MAPEMRDNDVPIFHLLSQTANWHLRPDFFYIVFFAKAPYWLSYRQVPFQRLLFGSALYKNSDLLSRVYHTASRKTIPDAKKAGYHRHDDTLPLFFTNGSDLHCSCPVPPNRGGANGAPAGGAFLVDIPEDWEPRAKQQPTGLIAYGTSCRRPVLVLYRPALTWVGG